MGVVLGGPTAGTPLKTDATEAAPQIDPAELDRYLRHFAREIGEPHVAVFGILKEDGTLTLRVGESAAPLATAFPISWRNRRPHRDTGNLWLRLTLSDSDIVLLSIEIDGDGKVVRIASDVIRV